jgi:hypothetical protein
VVEFVVGRRKGYGGFFELRRFAQRRFATLIIVQAKLTVNLCCLYRINYIESPAGTARRCEFDFARRYAGGGAAGDLPRTSTHREE